MGATSQNPFRFLTLAQLVLLQTQYLECLSAIAINQSYTINNRQHTRANLDDVTKIIGDLGTAIEIKQGRSVSVAQAVNWK